MSFLSSFYPQPVVAGTTEGTFAEGDDARIVGAIQSGGAAGGGLSGTYPNPTLAPVAIPYTTNTRAISDRFTDKYVNVLDFGADPTGVEDSALAIQRAIKYANSDGFSKENVMTLTYDDVITANGQPNVPRLFVSEGFPAKKKTVFLPSGTYKISRPLVIVAGVCLEGSEQAGGASLVLSASGNYNAIESVGVWSFREQAGKDGENNIWALLATSGDYIAGAAIRNIAVNIDIPLLTGTHPRTNLETYSWYHAPYGAPTFTTCTGSSGDTTIACSRDPILKIGTKIRFKNLPTIHTVVSSTTSTISIDPPLPTTLSSSNHLLFGIKAQGGIMVGAGENVVIERVFIERLAGNGIFITRGSPTPIIQGCMVSWCDVAYRCDVSPFTLVQPSGDGNNVFLECGDNKYWGNIIGTKCEELRSRISAGIVASVPYTANQFRTMFDLTAVDTGSHCTLNIIGGTFNLAGPVGSPLGAHSDFKTNPRSVIERHEAGVSGCVNWIGARIVGRLEFFVRTRQFRTGAVLNDKTIGQPYDGYETFSHAGGYPAFFDSTSPTFDLPLFSSNVRFRLVQRSDVGNVKVFSDGGIMMDKGASKRLQPSNFTRSGTTAEITYRNVDNTADANHDLSVGDWIQIYEYTSKTPSDSANLSVLSGSANGLAAGLVSFRVTSVISSVKFTIEVANSGADSGTIFFKSHKLGRMHTIDNNCHRFDLPSTAGDPYSEFRAFSIFDSENNQLVGLRSSQINDSRWWTKGELGLGGTIGNPASRILHGTGAPSASAPNGSLYLRTDGDASTTLYVRAGGAWKPLSSYEA